MLRETTLSEISDGKQYTANDLVRTDTLGCDGCHACCCHMEDTILLDPYDACCLCNGLQTSFSQLLTKQVSLTLVDGIILPHLAMDTARDCCSFLDAQGRCQIHSFRPGFCRLFPLGRFYDGKGFTYILQTNQCTKQHLSKVKVKQWIGAKDIKRYEAFICQWHYFLRDVATQAAGLSETLQKTLQTYLLKSFYLTPYQPDVDFYEQFSARLSAARELLL